MVKIKAKISKDLVIPLDSENPSEFIEEFIEKFLKPYYKKTNDWNKTLIQSINEIERICAVNRLSRGNLIHKLLNHVEKRLAKDISEMPGVDKIEIIFEGLEDYVEDIQNFVKNGGSQEKIRLNVSKLVENLNLFEISELLIHFANLSMQKTEK